MLSVLPLLASYFSLIGSSRPQRGQNAAACHGKKNHTRARNLMLLRENSDGFQPQPNRQLPVVSQNICYHYDLKLQIEARDTSR